MENQLKDGRNPHHIVGLERGHSKLGDVPFRDDAGFPWRTLMWPIYPSRVGLIQNDLGTVGYESDVGAAWTTGAPRACRLLGLMWPVPPFRLDEGFFSFSSVVTDSFEFWTSHRPIGRTSWP